jgi:hypothetical protein
MTNIVKIQPIQQSIMTVRIKSLSPFIQHKWSEKSLQMMKDKHAGLRVRNREVRDPHQEFLDATYRCEDGRYGFPAGGIKAALIEAAHKDIGLDKKLLRKSLFVRPDDKVNNLIAMETEEPIMREDVVRIGQSQTDIRYRPEFLDWAMTLKLEFDSQSLSQENILNLIERAGFGVGLGEWRPEKGGEYGRFSVDREFAVETQRLELVA